MWSNGTDDSAYQDLIAAVLPLALDELDIELDSVETGEKINGKTAYWLCAIVDPKTEDRRAPLTDQSAADHFAIRPPLDIPTLKGTKVKATVFDIEISDEASMELRLEDGTVNLWSPVLPGLAIARAHFQVD